MSESQAAVPEVDEDRLESNKIKDVSLTYQSLMASTRACVRYRSRWTCLSDHEGGIFIQNMNSIT